MTTPHQHPRDGFPPPTRAQPELILCFALKVMTRSHEMGPNSPRPLLVRMKRWTLCGMTLETHTKGIALLDGLCATTLFHQQGRHCAAAVLTTKKESWRPEPHEKQLENSELRTDGCVHARHAECIHHKQNQTDVRIYHAWNMLLTTSLNNPKEEEEEQGRNPRVHDQRLQDTNARVQVAETRTVIQQQRATRRETQVATGS